MDGLCKAGDSFKHKVLIFNNCLELTLLPRVKIALELLLLDVPDINASPLHLEGFPIERRPLLKPLQVDAHSVCSSVVLGDRLHQCRFFIQLFGDD